MTIQGIDTPSMDDAALLRAWIEALKLAIDGALVRRDDAAGARYHDALIEAEHRLRAMEGGLANVE